VRWIYNRERKRKEGTQTTECIKLDREYLYVGRSDGKKAGYGNKRRRMIADVGAIGPCDCSIRNGREEDLRCSES
jgi:hypothetical protein